MEKPPSPEQDDLTPEDRRLFEGNSWRLPNDIELVSKAEKILEERLRGVPRLDEDQAFSILMGFREILVNAIAHGNLRLESSKEDDVEHFAQRIQERRQELLAAGEPEKYVTVKLDLTPSRLEIVIKDEGSGFKLKEVPDPLDKENILKPAGRGILLAREFFNSVTYNEAGNEVTLIKILESPDKKTT